MKSRFILYKNYIIYRDLWISDHFAFMTSKYDVLTFSTIECNIKFLCIILTDIDSI